MIFLKNVLKTAWFAVALSITVMFVGIVVGSAYGMHLVSVRRGHVDGAARRKSFSEFMFTWSVPTFRLFRTVMRVDVVYRHRDTGSEQRLPPSIVVANHRSLLDIFLLLELLDRMECTDVRWIMKDALRRVPVVGGLCRQNGSVFIDRGDSDAAVEQIRACGEMAGDDGASVIIFPEGTRFTRPRDGSPYRHLLPPRPRGFTVLRGTLPRHDTLRVTIDMKGLIVKSLFQLGTLVGRRVDVTAVAYRGVPGDSAAAWLEAEWQAMERYLAARDAS